MQFNLSVKMDNAAFVEDPFGELAIVLQAVTDRLLDGAETGPIFDSNGNRVGSFEITGD